MRNIKFEKDKQMTIHVVFGFHQCNKPKYTNFCTGSYNDHYL